MVARVNVQDVRWSLEELSSEQEQLRLWLSDGSGGKEVSSFTEAQCGLFDDSHLGVLLDRKQSVFGDPADSMLLRLGELLGRIDDARHPSEIIADPLMNEVRSLAADTLKLLPR